MLPAKRRDSLPELFMWSCCFRRSASWVANETPRHDLLAFLLGRHDGYYSDERALEQTELFRRVVPSSLASVAINADATQLAFIEDVDGLLSILPMMRTHPAIARLPVVGISPRRRLVSQRLTGSVSGQAVLLCGGVATDGYDLIAAAAVIRDAGGVCDHAFVVFDEEIGAHAALAEHGITLHAFDCPSIHRAWGAYNDAIFAAEELQSQRLWGEAATSRAS